MANQNTFMQGIATSAGIGGGGGTTRMTARAYKTSDVTYGSGESTAVWQAKSDPNNIFDLPSGSFTIPMTFTGTVRVKVTMLLGITSVVTTTNLRFLCPIIRRTAPSALLAGIGTDYTNGSITSGQPTSGTSGCPFVQGTSIFEAVPGETYRISFYTSQSITTDSQGFQNWACVELEQM